MDSILNTTKKMLGIEADYPAFDVDIIVGINGALMTLSQLGVGPKHGFLIKGAEEVWSDFLDDRMDLEAVKLYVYLAVRLVFDPPSSSFAIEAINRQIEQYAWRINVRAEEPPDEQEVVL